LGIGLYLANLAASTIRASQLTQAALLAPVAQASIIVLAGAMALRQMGLANEIITSAFTILLGAGGIAIALAFGLGGREAAGKALDRFIESRSSTETPAQEPTMATPMAAPTQGTQTPGAPIDMPQQPGGPGTGTTQPGG